MTKITKTPQIYCMKQKLISDVLFLNHWMFHKETVVSTLFYHLFVFFLTALLGDYPLFHPDQIEDQRVLHPGKYQSVRVFSFVVTTPLPFKYSCRHFTFLSSKLTFDAIMLYVKTR